MYLCFSKPLTQRGAGIGAASEKIIGGILGNNLGKGGKGAMGAVLWWCCWWCCRWSYRNKMDKQARQIDEAIPGAEAKE
jgi:hypothetical protein